MSYKTIVALVETPKSAETLIPAACEIAKEFGAHFTCVKPVVEYEVPNPVSSYFTQSILEEFRANATRDQQKIKSTFDKYTASQDFVSEFRVENLTQKQKIRQLMIDTFGADLVLMALPTWRQETSVGVEPIHKLVMGSGRPVLVIPDGHKFDKIPQNILVGWRASPEASSAVHSALGFIKKAQKTTIMTVNKKKHSYSQSITDGREVAAMLDRHGATTKVWHSGRSYKSAGKQIANEAKIGGHDLIVIGVGNHGIGYNLTHSDGAKTVLKNTTVPVLLSA